MSARAIVLASSFVLLPLGVACSAADSSPEMTGEATAQITQVPAQVGCIQISVAGARTVQKRFDVMPGQSSVLSLSGLPVGGVSFTGSAYPTACASVTSSTAATWISDPTPATLGAGTMTNVALVLHRDGGASVGVDFQDDDAGTPPTMCMPGQVMCAGACTNTVSDVANCGACGAVCAQHANSLPSACVSGVCVSGACQMGFSDCNMNAADGCETDLMTSVTSCGACNHPCMTGHMCANGTCL
jgi:hypothetical protein